MFHGLFRNHAGMEEGFPVDHPVSSFPDPLGYHSKKLHIFSLQGLLHHKRRFYPPIFELCGLTRLLYPLEPIESGDVAEELRGHRAALGDEHIGAGLEVIERVDTVRRGGEDGDVAGLDEAGNRHLVDSREVGVDDTEATKGRHSGGHGALGDDVYRGGEDRREERNPTREACGEGDIVDGEVNVVREKDDVIIGVGVATIEELGGGELVLLHCCAALGFWVSFVGWLVGGKEKESY
ncbi:hypothetical protein FH972_018277 [Carpinus fangiana]|uniref:Uncharacterized protein n=1 Tax=Carpinus fangiana TaxID=176857 RepID=A0A5N6RQH5_9ROSI|nr:hypothetical protein FH972_018277 [Carpinus fangiana]